jgi:hypothetical protein
MPTVARFSGASLWKLNSILAAALRRVDGEAGDFQQLAEGEFQIVHKTVSEV